MPIRTRHKITGVVALKSYTGFSVFTKNGSAHFALKENDVNTKVKFLYRLKYYFPHLHKQITDLFNGSVKDEGLDEKDLRKFLIGKYIYGTPTEVSHEDQSFYYYELK